MAKHMIVAAPRLSRSVDELSANDHDNLSPLCKSTPSLSVSGTPRSPERHRATWRWNITHMRKDVSRIGRYLHRSLTDSSEAVTQTIPDIQCHHINADGTYSQRRRITIGAEDEKNRSKSSSKHSMTSIQSDELDIPDHNFSSSLVLKSLKDGNFSAEISLCELPPGDLIIDIRGHELDFSVERSHTVKDKKHRISIPQHYGCADLPIFVDETSLVFAQDAQKDMLFVNGKTKGYFARRRSLSHSMLQTIGAKRSGRNIWKIICSKMGFKGSHSQGTIVRSVSMDAKLDISEDDQLWWHMLCQH